MDSTLSLTIIIESMEYQEKLIRAFAIIGIVSTSLATSAIILTIIKYVIS